MKTFKALLRSLRERGAPEPTPEEHQAFQHGIKSAYAGKGIKDSPFKGVLHQHWKAGHAAGKDRMSDGRDKWDD